MPANLNFEESLRKGELSLETIFDAFTDGVYDYEVKNKFTVVNDSFYKLLGYEPGEFDVTNDRWDALIHPDDLNRVTALFDQHLAGETPRYADEYRMRRKDGSYQWISCTGRVIQKDTGCNPERVVGAIKSIQSKKQFELSMKTLIHATSTLKGEAFFGYMVEQMSLLFQVDYVLMVLSEDENPKTSDSFMMWNKTRLDRISYQIEHSPSEEIYQKRERVFVWKDLDRKYPNDPFILEKGIVGYYGVPVFDPNGKLLGHVCVMHDHEIVVREWMESTIVLFAQALGAEVDRISNEERLFELNKLLDMQVKERTVQLERAVHDLDSFFYKASHDLRAPITTLEGIYNLLESEIDTEEKAKLFKLLGSQIINIKKLNRSIIEVGNIRNHEPDIQKLKLFDTISEVVKKLDVPKDFELDVRVDESAAVKTDRFLFQNLLKEALSNGIKHRDSEKSLSIIRVEASDDNGLVQMVIKDNGRGISDRIERDYFKLFLRASTTSSGFGLGLYRAKLAADKANIALEIKSQEGVGTEVWLRFP